MPKSIKLVESKALQALIVKHRARVEALDEESPVEPPPGETGVRDRTERFYQMLRNLADHETRVPNQFDQLCDYKDPHEEVEATLAMVNHALACGAKQAVWALDVEDSEKECGAARFYFWGTEDEAVRRIKHMLASVG